MYAYVGFGTPHLAVASSDGSSATAAPTILTEALDRNISSPFFVTTGADESSPLIFFSVEDSGRVELASIRIDGSDLTRVLQGEYVLRLATLSHLNSRLPTMTT